MKTTFSLQGLLGLENLQGWSQHNLAGPVPVSGCPQRGKVSLHTVWSLLFQFKPHVSCLGSLWKARLRLFVASLLSALGCSPCAEWVVVFQPLLTGQCSGVLVVLCWAPFHYHLSCTGVGPKLGVMLKIFSSKFQVEGCIYLRRSSCTGILWGIWQEMEQTKQDWRWIQLQTSFLFCNFIVIPFFINITSFSVLADIESIEDDWCAVLMQNDFRFSLSIMGTSHYWHDRCLNTHICRQQWIRTSFLVHLYSCLCCILLIFIKDDLFPRLNI